MRLLSFLAAAAAIAALSAAAPMQQPSTDQPTIDRAADESVDLTDYVEREVRGWTVHVHPDLVADGSTLGAAVLELLDHELFEAARALPAPAVARLKRVPLWISLDETDWPGGVYHPSAEWLVANGHDPALAGCIQFGVAANLLTWERDQPSMLIHELAHAWHHQVVGYGDERLLEAYAAALESGSYESVLRGNGRRERAYALTNPQEYFAELSEARFGTNDFHPFVRAELGLHDPVGSEVVDALWRTGSGD